jgi:AbrB family looped-hinge helix DNA binding protein
MADWRAKLNAKRRPATRVSRNGQIVLPARARRAVGIEPGDLVVAVPVAPGAVLVEKVASVSRRGLRRQFEDEASPLRGAWGRDPDQWLDEVRGRWSEGSAS